MAIKPKNDYIEVAVKCAPEITLLSAAEKAGITAVELYLSKQMVEDARDTGRICKKFDFTYVLHAPNYGCDIRKLARLADELGAGRVIFHNIYWEDEWKGIAKIFSNNAPQAMICVENTYSVHEPIKFQRRFGFGRCLDLEHLQMETAGIFEEPFIAVMKQASHIHMTGYIFGTKSWHTHIHHSRKHSLRLLGLLVKTGYRGLVVSEARTSLQTCAEFKKLKEFFESWKKLQKT